MSVRFATCLLVSVLFACPLAAEDSESVAQQFASPSRDYATAPLWTWNDMLTEEQIISTMEDLAGQKVRQAFVHPRPGLMTPYLSDDWFRLWKVALREAERLDMNLWIYDENSYPSGFAGGIVSDAIPEARGKKLVAKESKQPPTASEQFVAAFHREGEAYVNISAAVFSGKTLPAGDYLTFSYDLAPRRGWFGGRFYVDLLHEGVTEKFIDVTMEAYRREIGESFGDRMPGWFTDEPHLAPAGGIHWSPHLPELFVKRWGYSLTENLPSLVRPVGDWRRVRHNYFQMLLEQFIDCWAKPCYDYCEKHNIEFTGHYWEHGWPDAGHGGDNMAMYAWHQRPAIDTLMNDYQENANAQFGNVRAVLELASVANQMGRERTLCEAYGAGGWDLRFEDMKRIGDWLYVLGVNTLDEHLSYVTIRGARKRDHPQSFSYHTPWWESYHVMAEYFTRLSLVMSSGEQINDILILEPTTSAWMYQGDRDKLGPLGERFQKLITDLAKEQIEFDLGCEDIISRHGSVKGDRFVVGQRSYGTVVLPADMENLNSKTLELLEAYCRGGGRLLCCGSPPIRLDGSPSDKVAALADMPGFQMIDSASLSQTLRSLGDDRFLLTQNGSDQGILFHHRRQLDDGQVVLLVNTSIESPCRGSLTADAKSIQRWNLQAGKVESYPVIDDAGRLLTTFQLPPCGSLLLFLADKAVDSAEVTLFKGSGHLVPMKDTEIRRLDPNVLPLDFVDVTAGDQSRTGTYFFEASKLIFQQHGLPDGNPWDRAVQFGDELITKTFADESGFQASYQFTIEDAVPKSIEIVVERPDLYTITCNRRAVEATKDAWWLDKSFGRIDLSDVAKVGENTVTISAKPLTMSHELEPAYVIGDFSVVAAASGFVIRPVQPLSYGSWKAQGMPLYGHRVAYRQECDVDEAAQRYEVVLPEWYGSVARVVVNGKPAGHIAYQPWSLDVSEYLRTGKNSIEVIVTGTLKNTLGPHHAGKMVGRAWPHAFAAGPESGPPPGESYDTLDYGLFKPFGLVQW